jgi:hypothetical protein
VEEDIKPLQLTERLAMEGPIKFQYLAGALAPHPVPGQIHGTPPRLPGDGLLIRADIGRQLQQHIQNRHL